MIFFCSECGWLTKHCPRAINNRAKLLVKEYLGIIYYIAHLQCRHIVIGLGKISYI